MKPFAFVVPRASALGDLVPSLQQALAARLATHRRPVRISVVAELPRTVTGKLQRHKLRAAVGPEA